LKSLADDLIKKGGKVLVLETDVTKRDQVKNLIDAAVEAFGQVDVLINNAGIMPLAPFDRVKVEEWDQTIDVNLKGTLYGIAAVLPHMMKQKAGQIINVSSVYGHKVGPSAAVYCGTKFAVRAISEGLRQEVKPYNIRTTIISPGAVSTELIQGISEPDIAKALKERVAKIGISPDSFARMVAFAISEPEDVDVNEILFRPTVQDI
jgi:NADP-dependent 3-hydroxy acid dehydrogenase YdfG